ncbi:MAG: hypothetical protein MZU95_08865 [Desulfomicrobium escambiense]|nr:hypothetical protein [Desulfomicrobium escambiense]
MCGIGCLVSMMLSRLLEGRAWTLLGQADSASKRSAASEKSSTMPEEPGMNFVLAQKERSILLATARESVESSLERREPRWPEVPPSLTVPRGAFVTLSSAAHLRGLHRPSHPIGSPGGYDTGHGPGGGIRGSPVSARRD